MSRNPGPAGRGAARSSYRADRAPSASGGWAMVSRRGRPPGPAAGTRALFAIIAGEAAGRASPLRPVARDSDLDGRALIRRVARPGPGLANLNGYAGSKAASKSGY
jgi:hypothetical protein